MLGQALWANRQRDLLSHQNQAGSLQLRGLGEAPQCTVSPAAFRSAGPVRGAQIADFPRGGQSRVDSVIQHP